MTACMSNPEPTPDRLPKKGTGAHYSPVYGELLAFEDPENRLPAIDRLEGFHPGVPASTTVFWSLSGQTEPCSRPRSMWVMAISPAGSRRFVAHVGPDSHRSVKSGETRKNPLTRTATFV